MGGTSCIAINRDVPDSQESIVSDSDLLARNQTQPLSKEAAETIIKENRDQAVQRFLQSLMRFIDQGPHEENELHSFQAQQQKRALSRYKSAFRDGSPGQNVAFAEIKDGEINLNERCGELDAAAEYANINKSYEFCTEIAAHEVELVRVKGQHVAKAMQHYRGKAKGPMTGVCGANLEALLGEYLANGEDGLFALRPKQIRREMEILRVHKQVAAQKTSLSDIRYLCNSAASNRSSELNPGTSYNRQGTTLFDVIARMPSIDMSDDGAEDPVPGLEVTSSTVFLDLEQSVKIPEVRGMEQEQRDFGFGDAQKTIFIMQQATLDSAEKSYQTLDLSGSQNPRDTCASSEIR